MQNRTWYTGTFFKDVSCLFRIYMRYVSPGDAALDARGRLINITALVAGLRVVGCTVPAAATSPAWRCLRTRGTRWTDFLLLRLGLFCLLDVPSTSTIVWYVHTYAVPGAIYHCVGLAGRVSRISFCKCSLFFSSILAFPGSSVPFPGGSSSIHDILCLFPEKRLFSLFALVTGAAARSRTRRTYAQRITCCLYGVARYQWQHRKRIAPGSNGEGVG